MPLYTVEIQAGNDDGTIWQAMEPAETVMDSGSAEQVALDTIGNQTILDLTEGGGPWRIAVWNGANADTKTAPGFVLDDQQYRDAQADALDRWEDQRVD